MKLFCKKKEPATYDEKYLLQELMMTKKAMYTAYSNLDNVTDPDLIDCYIYQLNSEHTRNGTITFLQRQKNLSYPRLDSDSIRIVVLYRYYIFYSINCQYLFYIFI